MAPLDCVTVFFNVYGVENNSIASKDSVLSTRDDNEHGFVLSRERIGNGAVV